MCYLHSCVILAVLVRLCEWFCLLCESRYSKVVYGKVFVISSNVVVLFQVLFNLWSSSSLLVFMIMTHYRIMYFFGIKFLFFFFSENKT